MKHQLYETWILLESKLTPAQERELQDHLKTCSQCRRLAQSQREIAHLFSAAPAPYPQPGFTTRWRKRLNKIEQRKKNLITWTTLSALVLVFTLTLVGLSVQVTSLSEYFPQLLTVGISQATRWLNFLASLQNIFSPLFQVGIKLIPQSWILAFIVCLSGIMFAWVITFSKNTIFFNKEVTG